MMTALLIERTMRIEALAKSAKMLLDAKETGEAFLLMSIIQDEAEFIEDQLNISSEGGAA